MGWEISPLIAYIFLSALLAIGIGVWALQERPDPVAVPLAGLMFVASAWAIPYAISIGFTDIDRVVRWQQLRYPGTTLTPVLYFVLTLSYAGYDATRKRYATLLVIPLSTMFIVATHPYHSLFWESTSITTVYGVSAFTPEIGLWHMVHLGYSYLLILGGLGVLAAKVIWATPVYRKQAGVIFLCGFIPFLANVAGTVGFGVDETIDLTALTLAFTGLAFAISFFRLDLLQLEPVARDHFVEELDDGVVVVDTDGLVRYVNGTAANLLTGVEKGVPATDVLPVSVPVDDERDVEIDDRVFRLRSTELTDTRGRTIAHIVYLNEVTNLIRREQRISVLNRVLRHNIRNDLNVVTSHLELIEPEPDTDDAKHARRALETTRSVIAFAEKARHIERTLQGDSNPVAVPVTPVLDTIVTKMQASYPESGIDSSLPDEDDKKIVVQIQDTELLEMALQELVENAIIHTDHPTPQVTIRLTLKEEVVHITVDDNGPGIPKQEQEILDSQMETALEHSSGLGLWLVQWTASLSSGELQFGDEESGTVTLTLPAKTREVPANSAKKPPKPHEQ